MAGPYYYFHDRCGKRYYMMIASAKQDSTPAKSIIFFMVSLFVYAAFMIVCFDDTKMRRQITVTKFSGFVNPGFRTA